MDVPAEILTGIARPAALQEEPPLVAEAAGLAAASGGVAGVGASVSVGTGVLNGVDGGVAGVAGVAAGVGALVAGPSVSPEAAVPVGVRAAACMPVSPSIPWPRAADIFHMQITFNAGFGRSKGTIGILYVLTISYIGLTGSAGTAQGI